LSVTVTVNMQVASGGFPFAAVHVTVVMPFANANPEAGLQVTVAAGHASEVGVANVATAVHKPGSVFLVIGDGHAPIVGGLTMVAESGAMVTEVKLVPVTLTPDPAAGLVTVQTFAGNGLLIVTWNWRVTFSPTGMVPSACETVSPDCAVTLDAIWTVAERRPACDEPEVCFEEPYPAGTV
jgi:hypothetical protein